VVETDGVGGDLGDEGEQGPEVEENIRCLGEESVAMFEDGRCKWRGIGMGSGRV
jgi:hypothetical protein